MSVAAIIPAYNEEYTVGVVIEALLSCPLIDEIIVVSDGSTDGTVQSAQRYPIKVVALEKTWARAG